MDEISESLRRALLDDDSDRESRILADAFFRKRPLQAGAGPQHVAPVISIAIRLKRSR